VARSTQANVLPAEEVGRRLEKVESLVKSEKAKP
jgi:hypothetical protein